MAIHTIFKLAQRTPKPPYTFPHLFFGPCKAKSKEAWLLRTHVHSWRQVQSSVLHRSPDHLLTIPPATCRTNPPPEINPKEEASSRLLRIMRNTQAIEQPHRCFRAACKYALRAFMKSGAPFTVTQQGGGKRLAGVGGPREEAEGGEALQQGRRARHDAAQPQPARREVLAQPVQHVQVRRAQVLAWLEAQRRVEGYCGWRGAAGCCGAVWDLGVWRLRAWERGRLVAGDCVYFVDYEVNVVFCAKFHVCL